MQIVVDPQLKTADTVAISAALSAYNAGVSRAKGPSGEIGILLKNAVTGATEGGLTAGFGADWMFIKLLFVPVHARGQNLGHELMAEAERIARDNHLTGIWLDTFSFQAPGFYEKLGYKVFGEIGDYPTTHKRYFLSKLL